MQRKTKNHRRAFTLASWDHDVLARSTQLLWPSDVIGERSRIATTSSSFSESPSRWMCLAAGSG
ncbi:hypothetical protein [Frigoribacterium sp. VKM Ac-2836]|uniref:hypothetical protein n=1 Tax=Frigoribacterium sp. VKM Ac-2836 TaxID=2739014 RepID=UPI0015674EAC|nr:hypothetical protein [Frigoribacterium sp. VKM Ac-2836]NRD27966.1 hypothetical protein [Frigoribacterium sp. VKM Ac-2836]